MPRRKKSETPTVSTVHKPDPITSERESLAPSFDPPEPKPVCPTPYQHLWTQSNPKEKPEALRCERCGAETTVAGMLDDWRDWHREREERVAAAKSGK